MIFRVVASRPLQLQWAPVPYPVVVVARPHRNVVATAAPQQPRTSAAVQTSGSRSAGVPRKAPIQPDPIAPDSLFDAATAIATLPEDIIGPLTVTKIDGRRAVVATRSLTTGELLLATSPIELVYAPDVYPDGLPEDEEEDEDEEDPAFGLIVERLTSKKFTERQLSWLKVLRTDGSNSREADPKVTAEPLPDVDIHELQKLDNKTQALSLPSTFSKEKLEDLAQQNAFFAPSEDVALAAMTDPESKPGVLGLWGQYAMLQHSCSPNTVSYGSGGKLVTRASRPGITKGTELTRVSVPNIVTTPLDTRREVLREQYGFVCSCARCTAEDSLAPQFKELVAQTSNAVNDDLRDELQDAIESAGTSEQAATAAEEKVNSIKDQLAAYVQTLDAAFEKYDLPEQTQVWVQASLFDMYEVLFMALAAKGEYEPRLTQLLTGLSGAVYPGSELHTYWAYMNMRQVQEICQMRAAEEMKTTELTPAVDAAARRSEEFKAADQLCFKAYCARYGRITPPVYRNVLETLRELEFRQMQALQEAEEGEEGEEGEQEDEDDSDVVDIKSEPVPKRQAPPPAKA